MTAVSARTCESCGGKLSQYNREKLCAPCSRGQAHPPTSTAPWLWVGSRRPVPPDSTNVGDILKAWRRSQALKQAQVADRLGWSQPYISQIESGRAKLRDVQQLWHLQRVLGIPPAELGLLADQGADALSGRGNPPGHRTSVPTGAGVGEHHRDWLGVRAYLSRERRQLLKSAASVYPDAVHVAGSSMISKPAWLFEHPVAFDGVALDWLADLPRPAVTGSESEAEHLRPPGFGRYSYAVRDLARPTLFENRPGYRLAEVDGPTLSFGYTSYFESIVDVSGAAAHEFAAAAMTGKQQLPFRELIGDPFDLSRRAVMPSINTLTIRNDGPRSTFLLHYRDPGAVAATAGVYHVMPAGMFQPSSIAPWQQANDFSLWRSCMREFAEELLDLPEADGSGPEPIDYAGTEPFASMEAAREAGAFRMWCYGIGLDPLYLYGEILTVAVVDAPTFDTLFAELATVNHEGSLVSANQHDPRAGIPFTAEHVSRLLEREPLAGAAAALLGLAWRDRGFLLG